MCFDAGVASHVRILQPYHYVNFEEKCGRAARFLIDFICAVYLVCNSLNRGRPGFEIGSALVVLFATR